MKFNKTRGFTILELMVVIAIIGILVGIVIPNFTTARIKGRDARRISDIKSIQLGLQIYYDTHRSTGYPTSLTSLVPTYIPAVPKDPSGSNVDYAYAALGSGTLCSSYHLGASLEGAGSLSDDVDVTSTSAACTGGGTDFLGTDSSMCSAAPSGTVGTHCYDVKP